MILGDNQPCISRQPTTIPALALIAVIGVDPQTGQERVALAAADDPNRRAVGIVPQALNPDRIGVYHTTAILAGTATNPINTSGLTVGAPIYLSAATAGAWTAVPPTGANAGLQEVGTVIQVHATRGKIRFDVGPWASAAAFGVRLGAQRQTLSAALAVGAGTYPLDLFPTTLAVPRTGTWELEATGSILQTGVPAGTALQQSIFLNFAADGALIGDLAVLEAAPNGFRRPYQIRQVLALTAGQEIGVQWGFGGAQGAAALTAQVDWVLSISPAS